MVYVYICIMHTHYTILYVNIRIDTYTNVKIRISTYIDMKEETRELRSALEQERQARQVQKYTYRYAQIRKKTFTNVYIIRSIICRKRYWGCAYSAVRIYTYRYVYKRKYHTLNDMEEETRGLRTARKEERQAHQVTPSLIQRCAYTYAPDSTAAGIYIRTM